MLDYPELRDRLSRMFLTDEETVEQCTGGDPERAADMADWLTNWTSTYIIQYDVLWWGENAAEAPTEKCWYAKAIDGGSFYPVLIPDHLVGAVLDVCAEQDLYYQSLYDLYRAENMIYSVPGELNQEIADYWVHNLAELLNGEDIRMDQGIHVRLDRVEADGVLAFTMAGTPISCYFQETEEGCLISMPKDLIWVETMPVYGILASGASERLAALVEEALTAS